MAIAADPFAPVRLGPITLRNRIIKAATFEGRSRDGLVTPELVAFHREVARGGVGMTTVAYCAVSPGGRVFRHCLVLDGDTAKGLRRLTDAVHDEGAAAFAQLGHAGLVAEARSNRAPTLAPSRRFSPVARGWVRAASRDDLRRVRDEFAAAARNAVAAGFDGVEVHLGHNYLLSSFLSPNLNRRRDAYGGPLEHRARFPREVLQAVREAVGDRAAVTAKLNMSDGTPDGFWLEESIAAARLLQDDGSLDAIELTGGSSLLNGMYFFRGSVPLEELAATQPRWARPVARALLRRIMPEYPFREAFFLPYARQLRAALDLPLILLGGINRFETVQQAVAEGFEYVAMARALLREPNLVNRWRAGATGDGLCIHCNRCAPTIYDRSGTRCVLRPPHDERLAHVTV